ncbi:MAG: metal ABC transporter ATP-binding protein [Candidatus Micrarchaeota archaeon]|nr:metal ABC transporter ATP-binding protein [Candidatus Micrarchaeota archaeon]
MNKVLEFKNVEFSYGQKEVFNSVNFSIFEGEFVALVGHNGAGKSTLAKLSLGLLRPQKGSVFLFSYDPTKFSQWQKVGYVPQTKEFELDFPISVFELVLLGNLKSKKGFFKFYSKEDVERANNVLKMLNLEKFKDNKVGELSGGQRQKVFLAQALVSNPQFLILDEPTANLDFSSENLFYETLLKLNKNKITIFLISHDIGQVLNYASRILVLNKKIIFDKSTAELSKEQILSLVEKI